MVIGFGVGGTDLRTKVQVYQGTEAAPLLLQEFEAKAESSKKPGMGPMVGVGAAATSAASAAAVSGGAPRRLVPRAQRQSAAVSASQLNSTRPSQAMPSARPRR